LVELTDRLLAVLDGHMQAWEDQDVEAILAYWGNETVHEDAGFGVELSGAELTEMPAGFFVTFPGFGWKVTDVFVANDVVLDISDGWGVSLRGQDFTEDQPMIEVDRTEVTDDGTLGRWTRYYGLATYELWNANRTRMEAAYSLIEAYRAAWTSPDPSTLASIYAPDATRTDSLFGQTQTGADEIAGFAAAFAAANPGAELRTGLGFSDNRRAVTNPERIGSVFTIDLVDAAGDPCTVRMAVILAVAEGMIFHEEVFWNADSLIACDWAV
jgi:hypothetical protein